MNKNLVGTWKNQYGSILNIESQGPGGNLSGTYASSTGATGVYIMNGWSPDGDEGNQPVSFSVSWAPVDGKSPDPSWHWVSGFSGALFLDAPEAEPTIQVLHGLVASTSWIEAEVFRPGVYTETLVFTRIGDRQDKKTPACQLPRGGHSLRAGAIVLKNLEPSSFYSILTFTFDASGNCAGTLTTSSGQNVPVQGIIDPAPASDGSQSLTLTGIRTDASPARTFSFGGILDLVNASARLELFEANAIAYANKYTGIAVSGEIFSSTVSDFKAIQPGRKS